jgi:hypothetical protein
MKDITGREFEVGQFVASSRAGTASVGIAYIVKLTPKRVRIMDCSYWAKLDEDYKLGGKYSWAYGNKDPGSLVIITPPREFVIKYAKAIKFYELPKTVNMK